MMTISRINLASYRVWPAFCLAWGLCFLAMLLARVTMPAIPDALLDAFLISGAVAFCWPFIPITLTGVLVIHSWITEDARAERA